MAYTPTKEQQAVIDARTADILVAAAAGSGCPGRKAGLFGAAGAGNLPDGGGGNLCFRGAAAGRRDLKSTWPAIED